MTDGSLCLTGPHSIVSIQLPSLFIYSTELEGFSSKRSVRVIYMYVATVFNFTHQLEIHSCLVINSRESKGVDGKYFGFSLIFPIMQIEWIWRY